MQPENLVQSFVLSQKPDLAPEVVDLWNRRFPRYLYVEDLLSGARVVEIGCAGGLGCEFLREKGAAHTYGVDRDRNSLDRARKLYGDTEFLEWRGQPLPIEPGSVDLVLVPEALEWLE